MPKYLCPNSQEEADEPWWWAPLVGVGKSIEGIDEYRFFDVDDFMLMCVPWNPEWNDRWTHRPPIELSRPPVVAAEGWVPNRFEERWPDPAA